MFYFDPMYLVFVLPAFLLGIWAQYKVKGAYAKYVRVPNQRGLTGLAAAQIEVLRHFCLKAARAYRYEIVSTDRSPDEIADYVLNRMLALRALK